MSPIIQETIGKTVSFNELKDNLFRSGINLFPEADVFCYCDGNVQVFLLNICIAQLVKYCCRNFSKIQHYVKRAT